jgi:hypothetical protein
MTGEDDRQVLLSRDTGGSAGGRLDRRESLLNFLVVVEHQIQPIARTCRGPGFGTGLTTGVVGFSRRHGRHNFIENGHGDLRTVIDEQRVLRSADSCSISGACKRVWEHTDRSTAIADSGGAMRRATR